MNALPPSVAVAANASYETTRFNALQHGVLSRHTVLAWEDRGEYQALLDALVAEHGPNGPTEGHLVEELAGMTGLNENTIKVKLFRTRQKLLRAAGRLTRTR